MVEQVPIGARVKPVLTVQGLTFKDLNGNGRLDPYEDWRLSPAQRAADLVSRMSVDEKVGLMVINSRSMGLSQPDPALTSHDGVLDEQYHPVRNDPHNTAGKPYEGTTQQITDLHMRHFIMRETPPGSAIATWVNAMNEVAEGTRLGIPVLVAANSKNELGGFRLGATPHDRDFTQWPGTLGLAATADLDLIRDFAEKSRTEWVASGLRKGYMYMADTATDPRWFRTNGTFGEDPEFVSRAIATVIRAFQGEDGLGRDGVALTVKHFPGGGARENGFDPHYAEGRFNVYPTPESLKTYHLPPFQAAIDAGAASIMPYYAIPSDEKSAMPQPPLDGFEQVGFAFNRPILDLLRAMGHQGYVNSDSGILSKMAWGVSELSVPERVGRAVTAGTDIIADTNDVESIRTAFLEELFSTERLDEAAYRLVWEMFALGLFDDPYVDPEQADEIVANERYAAAAAEAHRRSVVLMKNHDGALPLTPSRPAGQRVYVELFERHLTGAKLDRLRADLAAAHPDIDFTADYRHADVAVLFLNPFTGSYFDFTGLLDLDIHEATHVDLDRIRHIRSAVPRLVVGLNVMLPWLLGAVEPLADALVAGFDTRTEALFAVIVGDAEPRGRLPLTFPADHAAIAVDDNGICASPNDVPGFDKEKFMNGRPYVYVDSDGNRYQCGHGLTYTTG
ncbi:glycoside hydrolase family 3 N-terminal domain-containing protein [Amorphoplanes nipponensis]|uniref:beta-glucosidase n=1 Tax=Actinoplanes nipponensis TaxID=135950 RepID=A0A919JDG2_9ACTN|nr:glycoside hydrolase family 3 N-terminal domain-containing protein [Actinoplanes nipponensis]GIE46902.1 beta-glucosidase [Actinoplanes nipponensis]